tara:strand:- start:1107 stop:1358 length:252 start_codon:yes stop_codon:yes gene_type:complete
MNLYVVFINPLFYKSNNKLTQVECHFFTDMTEASEFAEENGGVEVYSRVYWNDEVSEGKWLNEQTEKLDKINQISDIYIKEKG